MIFSKHLTKFRNIQRYNSLRFFRQSAALFGVRWHSPNADLDKNVYDRYMCLPTPETKVQATYIWIDGTGEYLRSKSRTLDSIPNTYKELPTWGFNGMNTMQACPEKPDCHLIPIAMYNDPIRRGNHKLVLCEAYDPDGKPSKTNHRQKCVEALNKVCDHDVEAGFEQEYLLTGICGRPYGWPLDGQPWTNNQHYACVGPFRVYGREITESFYRSCLYCGIDIYGDKPEIVLGQWEFKTGPTKSIKAADDLWTARWLLIRIAEDFGVGVSFNPKLVPHLPGSGLHTTFSTKKMRDTNGLQQIEEVLRKLEKKHKEHIKVYDPKGGELNKNRLTGEFQSSCYEKFTKGVGIRNVSVRISQSTINKKKGYIEDRRPAANADPYQIINALVRTCLL